MGTFRSGSWCPGSPRVTEFHHGVDLAAPHGTGVKATADGSILSAAYEKSLGYYVKIDHGYGITTLYAHLSQIDVSVGQEISRNDIIGRVGNTGRSTGTHLHYGIIVNGLAVDPMKFTPVIQATQPAQAG